MIFDLHEQVELYTHNNIVQNIVNALVKSMDMILVIVNLIDVHNCMDVHKYISSALLSTRTMLRLELPAVNLLSKIDLLSTFYGNHDGDCDDNGDGDDISFLYGMSRVRSTAAIFRTTNNILCLIKFHRRRNIRDDEEYQEYQEARRKTIPNIFYNRRI